jgi:sterol 3beta-glucosyltransferase
MSRIVIAAIGSRGDVAPLTGIGVRLRDAGHDVVRGCGLAFRELDPARIEADPDGGESDRGAAGLLRTQRAAGNRGQHDRGVAR